MRNIKKIQFNGRIYDEHELENEQTVQELLSKAKKTQTYPVCLCNDLKLQLVPRKYQTGLQLCLWPKTGSSHYDKCTFYNAHSHHSKLRISGISLLGDKTTIKSEFAINLISNKKKPNVGTGITGASDGSRGTADLQEIIRHLWQEIGLYGESDGIDDLFYHAIGKKILEEAQRCEIKQCNLADVLFIPTVTHELCKKYPDFIRLANNICGLSEHSLPKNRFISIGLFNSLLSKEQRKEAFSSLRLNKHGAQHDIDINITDQQYKKMSLLLKSCKNDTDIIYSNDKNYKYWFIGLFEPIKSRADTYYYQLVKFHFEKMSFRNFLLPID